MRRKGNSILVWCLVLLAAGCIDSYKPPLIDTNLNYLVVDGFINSGEGATTIKLTHLMKLATTGSAGTELKAAVSVEGENSGNYLLTEKGNGIYTSQLAVNSNQRYRIRIKTKAGKEYLSDFVSVKNTPAIDNVIWEVDRTNNGLQTYVTTHDPTRQATYYQWEYEETWQYHSDCNNPLDNPSKYTCWKSENSSKIFVSSSVLLSQDVISHFPLTFVNANSEKPYIIYSINVKQYAITKEAYDYLNLLKKTSEQMGSIFDAQPAQLTGNIRCISDPSEMVLGYMTAHSVSQKRVFIQNSNLPIWFYKIPSWYNCPPPEDGPCAVSANCSDCRVRGGTTVKPDFWIY